MPDCRASACRWWVLGRAPLGPFATLASRRQPAIPAPTGTRWSGKARRVLTLYTDCWSTAGFPARPPDSEPPRHSAAQSLFVAGRRLRTPVLALVFGQRPEPPLLLAESFGELRIDGLGFERAGLDRHVLPQSNFDNAHQRLGYGALEPFAFRAVHGSIKPKECPGGKTNDPPTRMSTESSIYLCGTR